MQKLLNEWRKYLTEDQANDAVWDAIWGSYYLEAKDDDPTSNTLKFLWHLRKSIKKAQEFSPKLADQVVDLYKRSHDIIKKKGLDYYVNGFSKEIELGKKWDLEEITVSTSQRTNQGRTKTEQTGYMWKMK
jgi:hypothetical protein